MAHATCMAGSFPMYHPDARGGNAQCAMHNNATMRILANAGAIAYHISNLPGIPHGCLAMEPSMKSLQKPAFLAALGLCLHAAIAFCVPQLLLYLYFWVFTHFEITAKALTARRSAMVWMAIGILSIVVAGMVLVFAGLTLLLRRIFRIRRTSAIAWAAAGVATGLWPLAALLPAACRLGNRPAVHRAAWGGGALLFAYVLAMAGGLATLPVYWPILLASLAGTGLVLAALYAIGGASRPLRALRRTFAVLVVLSLATQPALHAVRVRHQADEAFAALLERLDPPIAADLLQTADLRREFSGKTPEETAFADEKASFVKLREQMIPGFRRHPLTSEECAAIDLWFASHTNLLAMAGKLSPPMDSMPAETDANDDTPSPTCLDALAVARCLVFRAKAAADAGDAAVAADAFRRIGHIAARFEPALTFVDFLTMDMVYGFLPGPIQCRIDLWAEDDLMAVQRATEEAAESVERRLRIAIAGESVADESLIRDFAGTTLATYSKATRLLYGNGILDYWIAMERRSLYRERLADWEAVENLIRNWPADGAADGEIRRLGKEVQGKASTPLASVLKLGLAASGLPAVVSAKNNAVFARTAIAIERYRRAHGGELPPTLDALVPDFLPGIPRCMRTGSPLDYDPGPLDIPEEEIDVFQNPDQLVAVDRQKDLSWAAGLLTPEGSPENKEAVRRIKEEIRQNIERIEEGAEQPKRTLPALTLPGFRLAPGQSGRRKYANLVDFVLGPTPAPTVPGEAQPAGKLPRQPRQSL